MMTVVSSCVFGKKFQQFPVHTGFLLQIAEGVGIVSPPRFFCDYTIFYPAMQDFSDIFLKIVGRGGICQVFIFYFVQNAVL